MATASFAAEAPPPSATEIAALATVVANAPVTVDDNSFQCMRKMTPVRHFYVDNLLGNTAGTLAAANAPNGAVYPAGSVVQLVPTEVMVKRETGFNPATGDWEFFELDVDEKGSKIGKRGFAEVNNRFGKNCFACHAPARECSRCQQRSVGVLAATARVVQPGDEADQPAGCQGIALHDAHRAGFDALHLLDVEPGRQKAGADHEEGNGKGAKQKAEGHRYG